MPTNPIQLPEDFPHFRGCPEAIKPKMHGELRDPRKDDADPQDVATLWCPECGSHMVRSSEVVLP